jgi:hypothetical protein
MDAELIKHCEKTDGENETFEDIPHKNISEGIFKEGAKGNPKARRENQ